MTWAEVDLDAGVWTIPAARMKAGETTGFPREVIEAALAHGIKDKAEAAYARLDFSTSGAS